MALLLPYPVLAARIQVSLDRNPVPINESFTVTFAADEEPDGDPDFSPLQANFEILNQGQSNRVSIVNGRATRSLAWQLQVLAKTAGTLEIPPIAFGADRSQPFAVTITNGAVRGRQGGGASIYLEAEAEPKNPYVQAQVILTLRVLSRVAFSGDLGQPEVPDALVEKLDEDREYVTLRDGVQFKVDERRFAVFPQKSGRLTIPAVNLTAQLSGSGGGGFGPFFRAPPRQQRLHSDPLDLDVRPIPAQFKGAHWLPAKRLELAESWQPSALEIPAGEPVTRTVTLKAEGATIGMLPEWGGPDLPASEVKQYPDQPVTQEQKANEGLISQRQQKIALMATRPGRFTVPALEVPWLNTATDRMEVARLPARTVTVMPSALSPAPEPIPPKPEAPGIQPEGAAVAPVIPAGSASASSDRWFWLAAGLGLGWLATALAWWCSLRRSRPVAELPTPSTHPREKTLVKALERACRANDPVAARKALDLWAALQRPDLPPGNLDVFLASRLGTEINLLNRSLYAQPPAGWEGGRLWERFQADLNAPRRDPREPSVTRQLAGLYKTAG